MKEKQEQIKILQWELLDIQYQKASNNIKNLINHTLNIYEKNSNPLDPKSESFYRYYYSIFGGQPVKR